MEKMKIKKHLMSLSETEAIAREFAKVVEPGDLLLFTGEIGTGKTTFIQSLAKYIGVKENVTSPTFVIQRLHDSGEVMLSHVDLYRLNNDDEVESIGFEEYYDDAVTAIEWADRYTDFQPPYVLLDFQYGEQETERFLTITAEGGNWEKRLAALN